MIKFLKTILVFFLVMNSSLGMDSKNYTGLPSMNKISKKVMISGILTSMVANGQSNDVLNNQHQEIFNNGSIKSYRNLQGSSTSISGIFTNQDFSSTVTYFDSTGTPVSFDKAYTDIGEYNLSYSPLFTETCVYSSLNSVTGALHAYQRPLSELVCSNRLIGAEGCTLTAANIQAFNNLFRTNNGNRIMCPEAGFFNNNDERITFSKYHNDHNLTVSLLNYDINKFFSYDVSTRSSSNSNLLSHQLDINTPTESPIRFNINNNKNNTYNALMENNVFMADIPNCNDHLLAAVDEKNKKNIILCRDNENKLQIQSSNIDAIVLHNKVDTIEQINEAIIIVKNKIRSILKDNTYIGIIPFSDYVLLLSIYENNYEDAKNTAIKICADSNIDNYQKPKDVIDAFNKIAERIGCAEFSYKTSILDNIKKTILGNNIKDKELNIEINKDQAFELNSYFNNNLKIFDEDKNSTQYSIDYQKLLNGIDGKDIIKKVNFIESSKKRLLFDSININSIYNDGQILNARVKLMDKLISNSVLTLSSIRLVQTVFDFFAHVFNGLKIIDNGSKLKLLSWGQSWLYINGYIDVSIILLLSVHVRFLETRLTDETINGIFSTIISNFILTGVLFVYNCYKAYKNHRKVNYKNLEKYINILEQYNADSSLEQFSTNKDNLLKSIKEDADKVKLCNLDLNSLQKCYCHRLAEVFIHFHQQEKDLFIKFVFDFIIIISDMMIENKDTQTQQLDQDTESKNSTQRVIPSNDNLSQKITDALVFLELLLQSGLLIYNENATLISTSPLIMGKTLYQNNPMIVVYEFYKNLSLDPNQLQIMNSLMGNNKNLIQHSIFEQLTTKINENTNFNKIADGNLLDTFFNENNKYKDLNLKQAISILSLELFNSNTGGIYQVIQYTSTLIMAAASFGLTIPFVIRKVSGF